MKRPFRAFAPLLVALALFALPRAAPAQGRSTVATAAFEFQENPLYARLAQDILGDRVARVRLEHGIRRELAVGTALDLALTLDAASHDRLKALDTVTPGVRARLTRKPGIGYFAARYFLEASLERIDARKFLLDGTFLSATAGAEKWLGRKTRGRLYAGAERRDSNGWTEADGTRNEPYDLKGTFAGASLEYVPDGRLTIRAGVRARRGDGVVHYRYGVPAYGDVHWYRTDDYGPHRWGYRLEGMETFTASLALERALSDRGTVALSHERHASRWNALRYRNAVTALRFTRSF